jgi:glycosyltransferase involved in cell wall biosynthesis
LIKDVPFTVLLAGDGVEYQKLANLVQTLGLEKQVHLLGFQRDIPAFLAGIDIFVTPSLSEGMSISLLEAMAAARPIVATSILANSEVIEHKVTGLLVPVRSPKEIAQSVANFVQEPKLAKQCGEAARRRVLEYYTFERMFQETWKLYSDLLRQRGNVASQVLARGQH